MEFRILDENFIDKIILSQYESILWVDRYNEPGDFEIYTPPTDELLEVAKVNSYLYSKDSEHVMIIEHVELTTSFAEGPRLIIKGRSLESILQRRIMWYRTQVRNNLEDAIRQILDISIIKPDDPTIAEHIIGYEPNLDRKINNFIFEYSNDPSIVALYADAEFNASDDLLTVITSLCKTAGVGYKITLNDRNQFVFKLYNGANRSYTQDTNPWIVFSPRYHNLRTTQFSNDITDVKNCVRTIVEEDNQITYDFITYSNTRNNILIVDGAGTTGSTDAPEVQIENGSHRFQFRTGKLVVGQPYSFTASIIVDSGSTDAILCKLTGELPYTRIYDTKTLSIQNGRIYGTFIPIKPEAEYDDCFFLEVFSGANIAITLVDPIFSPGAYETKASGLNRREVLNDGTSVERTDEMTVEEYEGLLLYSAEDTLNKNIAKTEINGEVEVNATRQYGVDYFMGDIVQVENEYGILGTMRVTEFITSHSTSGIEMYPTFKSIGGEE